MAVSAAWCKTQSDTIECKKKYFELEKKVNFEYQASNENRRQITGIYTRRDPASERKKVWFNL